MHKDIKEDRFQGGEELVNAEEVSILRRKIESLQYQNEINIQRLFALELEDEQRRKELIEKDKILKRMSKKIKN